MARPKKIPKSGRPVIGRTFPMEINDGVVSLQQANEIRRVVGNARGGEPYIPADFQLKGRLNIMRADHLLKSAIRNADLDPVEQREYLDVFIERFSKAIEVLEVIGEASFMCMHNEGAFKTGTNQSASSLKGVENLFEDMSAALKAAKRTRKSMGDGRSAPRKKRRDDLHLLVEDLGRLWFDATGREPCLATNRQTGQPCGPFIRFVEACEPYFPLKKPKSITANSIAGVMKK